ncbi:hypothetical protein tb265_11510 [Gemmatimonadetes bacterium T265]|nr:hypothetical protein tb265_11510 [Gemmatimonadetes bacterium T265]
MKRTVLLYGLVAGALTTALRVVEYRYLVVEHALQLYGGLVAALFAALGVWLGRRFVRPRAAMPVELRVETREVVVERVREVPVEVVREVVREVSHDPPPASSLPGAATVAVAAPTTEARDATDQTPLARRLARFGVTRREHEILTLIAEGLSTREIAARLAVSEHTVKSHAGRLFDKLGARRRTQVVQSARAAGLLP